MSTEFTPEQISKIKTGIAEQLNLPTVPLNIAPDQVEKLGIANKNTLACWRSSGRYNLPYVKMGRRVMYPLDGIAQFLLRRTIHHTGEGVA